MPTILIAGGTGLIGQRLSRLLAAQNHTVLHLSRTRNLDAEFPAYHWDLQQMTIDEDALAQADIVINLAGAGVADKRWSAARKKLIMDSRINGNLLLKKYFSQLDNPPQAYLSASAIGYYGNRGDTLVQEDDPAGDTGFLPKSVVAWEKAIAEVAATGVRTVAFRTGIVLSTQGGALAKMLEPLQFLLAAYFGNGQQWYSWIHIDDVCRMYLKAIEDENMQGTFNAVAPHPVTNKELTQQLVKASGKPAIILPAPTFALRLVFGEMADAILDSTKVGAEKIQQADFTFEFPELYPALQDLLKRNV